LKDEKLTGFQNATTLVDIKFSFTKDHPILVVTDEISRGHHIAGVADVINYDLPETCAVFLERTGKFSVLLVRFKNQWSACAALQPKTVVALNIDQY
jgi:hypothetical protein